MPAAYIHENIAKKALGKIVSIPSYIKNNMDAFEFGAQGPDVLFFYNIIKFWDKDFTPNRLGEYMHKHKVNDFIRTALKYAKKNGGAALAWITGFVAHYAADATIHPFVYARTNSEDGTQNILQHLLLESQFDTWYYRSQGNKGIPRQARCTKTITHSQKSDIASTLSQACSIVYPDRHLTINQAYKTIGDMNNLINLLYSPYKIKHSIYKMIEAILKKPLIITSHEVAQKLPEYDFLNLKKDTWVNPWDKTLKYDYSFPILFDIATQKAAIYIETAINYLSDTITLEKAASTFENISYSSGLPIVE